eukprot:2644240-Pleurochrysis_carterae.AAC.2
MPASHMKIPTHYPKMRLFFTFPRIWRACTSYVFPRWTKQLALNKCCSTHSPAPLHFTPCFKLSKLQSVRAIVLCRSRSTSLSQSTLHACLGGHRSTLVFSRMSAERHA